MPSSTLVPSSRTTSGMRSSTCRAAATMPLAMTSHFMMPPKMLTRTAFTSGSARRILKAAVTFCLVGAAAHVEEVRRLPARELDHVHGGHGQAGAVHHAADVAVERDVGEVVLLGLGLLGILLVGVAQRGHVLVAEERVVVEVHLGVERQHRPLVGDHQRVHLDERRVGGEARLVEAAREPHEGRPPRRPAAPGGRPRAAPGSRRARPAGRSTRGGSSPAGGRPPPRCPPRPRWRP